MKKNFDPTQRSIYHLHDFIFNHIIFPMRLQFFPYPFLFGLLILFFLILILRLAKRSWSYLFFFSVFWMYLLLMVGLVVFPIPLVAPLRIDKFTISFQYALSEIHLIPYNYPNFDYFSAYTRFEILTNVILTIPFGFGILWVWPSLSNMMLPMALLVGFMNETAQFLLMVLWGFSYRVVDVNDVILNTLGFLIGYILFLIFTWSLRGIVKLFRIKPGGIFQYIVETGKKSKKPQII